MENLKNEFENFLQEMVENNLNTLKKQNAEYASCKDDEKIVLKLWMNLLVSYPMKITNFYAGTK